MHLWRYRDREKSDAGVDYGLVEQAYVGYVFGDSTAGQAALYGVGLTGKGYAAGPKVPGRKAHKCPCLDVF